MMAEDHYELLGRLSSAMVLRPWIVTFPQYFVPAREHYLDREHTSRRDTLDTSISPELPQRYYG